MSDLKEKARQKLFQITEEMWNNLEVSEDYPIFHPEKYHRTKTQSIEEFIALILRRRAKSTPNAQNKAELRESDAHLKRLLKIFEKKLLEDENA